MAVTAGFCRWDLPQDLRLCPSMALAGAPTLAATLVLRALLLLAAGPRHFIVDVEPELFGRTSLVALLQGLDLELGFPLVTAGPGP